jgi:hypothetical protein
MGVPTAYACNEILGLWLTDQWWMAGFINDGIPAAKWQEKQAHGAYLEVWANPNGQFWGVPVQNPCAMNSASPDRVIFVAANWTFTMQSQWEAALTMAVGTIKAKYPMVRNIEFIASIRCPDSCGTPPAPPAESAFIRPLTDAAFAAVAAKSPGFVTVGPKFTEPCANWVSPTNSTHLTPAGNADAAKQVAMWYATR